MFVKLGKAGRVMYKLKEGVKEKLEEVVRERGVKFVADQLHVAVKDVRRILQTGRSSRKTLFRICSLLSMYFPDVFPKKFVWEEAVENFYVSLHMQAKKEAEKYVRGYGRISAEKEYAGKECAEKDS